MHNAKSTHPKSTSTESPSSQPMADKQRDAINASYLKKLANDRKKIDELQNTHTVLQQKLPKLTEGKKGDLITKATLAYSLLSDLIDECIYDVLFEAHRDIKQATSVCQICQTRCRAYVSRPGCDIYGNSYQANNLPSYECVNCHKMIAAGRYAPHLEKCLGLAGRQSSRVANRRLGSAPPFALSDDSSNALSDPESDLKKKKRPVSSSSANGIARVKKLKNGPSSSADRS